METEIKARGGEVPFVEFMRLALYHPKHGYYSGDEPRYGRGGDFLTAPTASPWYGRVLAAFLRKVAHRVGPITVVDLAAGDGSFASILVGELGLKGSDSLRRVVLVEQSSAMRRLAAKKLDDRVEILADLADAGRPEGPVLLHASELYDAMPVDRVVAGESGLEELWVEVDAEGGLGWRRRKARSEVGAYFAEHAVELQVGQVAEANRGAADAHCAFLEWAGQNGVELVLDYGYGAKRLYNPRGKAQGSLVCYHRHELSRDPLQNPGACDITAHVNWDDLRRSAGASGWREVVRLQLAELLVRAGLAEVLEQYGLGEEAELDARSYAARQEIKRLLDPDGMGVDLKALIHGRGELADVFEQVLATGA